MRRLDAAGASASLHNRSEAATILSFQRLLVKAQVQRIVFAQTTRTTGAKGPVGRKNSIRGQTRPLIDLMQPTESRLRRGRVFSGARGGLHRVYHWPA